MYLETAVGNVKPLNARMAVATVNVKCRMEVLNADVFRTSAEIPVKYLFVIPLAKMEGPVWPKECILIVHVRLHILDPVVKSNFETKKEYVLRLN